MQNNFLLDRLHDLENRSRRAIHRIVNIPEGSKNGQDPVEFISELLRQGMGADLFPKPLKIKKAHCTHRPKLGHVSSTSSTFMLGFH